MKNLQIKTNEIDLKTLEDVYNNEYFKINKILQEQTGLWPYRSRFDKTFRRLIVIFSLSIVTLPHFNAVRIWCGKNLGLCAENISGVVYVAGVLLKYIVTVLSEDKMSKVFEQLAVNWLSIQDNDERAIMLEYATIGKFKSVGYVGYLGIAAITFTQIGLIPTILDFIIPLNQSRQKILMVKAEYFVDPFEYYFEIYLLYCYNAVISVTVLMSIDTTYTAVVHQNLAVFNVVKYRLQQSTKIFEKDENYAYNKILSAIRLHKDSIEFTDLLESTYDTCFLVLICICILFLTFGAITIMENSNSIMDLIRMTMFEIGTAIHLFYLSWPGQLVISESSELYLYTYMNEWYLISEKAKTLLKIMMLRCLKPCCLTAAGLYIMNFENYGVIIKTTVSYITVVASFR